jgi:type VI secretion system secreted protein Hcp
MKIEGIPGDATTARFKGWIQVEAAGPESPKQSGAGGTQETHGIVISRRTDRSSPALYRAALASKHIPRVIIVVEGGTGGESMGIVLENTLISSYQFSGTGVRPMESLSLNFTAKQMLFGAQAQALAEKPAARPGWKATPVSRVPNAGRSGTSGRQN